MTHDLPPATVGYDDSQTDFDPDAEVLAELSKRFARHA